MFVIQKKDVLIMCQFFYPEYITSSLLPFQTAKYLVENGNTVDVLCGYPKEYYEGKEVPITEQVEGITINRVKYSQFKRGNKLSRLANYFSFVTAMFFRLHRIRRYSVVMVYSTPPILPLITIMGNCLFGTKIVFVAYDIYPEIATKTEVLKNNGLIDRLMGVINNKLYRNADVVALSNEMKEFIVANRNIKPDKVHVIPNWATEEETYIPVQSQSLPNHEDEFTILYLGNMGIAQEFTTILEAMKLLQESSSKVRMIFAGHGNQVSKIQEYVHTHQLRNVDVYGYLNGSEKDAVLNKANMLFLSLKNELHGLAVPSKYYTYLLEGKPILAVINSQSDIAKEISEYQIGITVDEGDAEELAEAIRRLKDDQHYSVNRSIYQDNFSSDIQLGKYKLLVQKVLEEK